MSEFPAHWDFKTIGDFASRVRTKNTGGECQDPMTISAIDGLVSQRDYFNKIVASKNTEGYTLLHKNDFAYNKSYSDGYPVGAVRRLKTKDRGIVSPLYICFELDREQIDLQFADYLFDSDWFVQAIYGIAKEGARSHGLLNIGIEEFFSASLPIPPLPEQKKIAEILSGIDREIELLDRRIQKLCIAKAKASEDILSSDRSEKKLIELSDCIDLTRGYAFKSSDYIESGGTRILRVTNIKEDGRVDLATNCVQIPNQLRDHYRHFEVQEDDLLLVMVGATTGKLGIASKEDTPSLLNQNIWCLRSSSPTTLLQRFLHCSMPKVVAQHLEKQQGSARDFLTQKEFFKEHLEIPNIDLQEKVVNATSCIDRTILATKEIRAKIGLLKFSLSSDLLSGRKRVSI